MLGTKTVNGKAAGEGLWMWLHRWSGLVIMAFIALAALTGCVLVLGVPIDHAVNAAMFRTPESSVPRLAPLAAVEKFQRDNPNIAVTNFPLEVDPGMALVLTVAPQPGGAWVGYDQLFLDPATGKVLGTRKMSGGGGIQKSLMTKISHLHKNLLLGNFGRVVMGVAALVWLLTNFIGIWLTVPRRAPRWRQWLRMWKMRASSPFARQMLDLHRASGLWLLLPLTLLAFTSVAFNFEREIYLPALEKLSPPHNNFLHKPVPFLLGTRPTIGFGDALRFAEAEAVNQKLEGRPASMMYDPGNNHYAIAFTPDGKVSTRGLGPVSLYVDAVKGRFLYRDDPYHDSFGVVMERMIYPVHSGRVLGWPGQALVFVLGLVTFAQTATGLYVWWKKRRTRLAGS